MATRTGTTSRRTRPSEPDTQLDGSAGVPKSTTQHRAHGTIASHTPGRLRVRVHRSHRDPHVLHELASQLEDQPGIDHVDVNAGTGSVLVHYDHMTSSRDDVVGCLEDVGLVIGSILEAGGDEVPDLSGGDDSGHSTTAKGVVDTLNDLDQRLSRMTGRKVDLKLLFPVALGAFGIRSAIVNGFGVSEVPAYILIWYAFDTFWKFHQRQHSAGSAGDAETTSI